MKKFLAIVFTLIFALSACTVAFATAENLTCESCKAKLVDEKAYNAHINGGCQVDFKTCEFCKERVATTSLEDHYKVCPSYKSTCEYCGESFNSYDKEAAHECKIVEVAGGNEDVANIIAKALEALKSVDWAELANKVVDAVKSIDLEGIIAKVKPIIEKVVAFVGEIELPAAK